MSSKKDSSCEIKANEKELSRTSAARAVADFFNQASNSVGRLLVFLREKIELLALLATLVVIWGLLLLPIIYFHTDIEIESIDGAKNETAALNDSKGVDYNRSSSDYFQDSNSSCSLACRKDFFCDAETETCLPLCPDWSDYSATTAKAVDVLVLMFACVGFLSAVGVLIISCARRKQVFTFPSIFVLYETITIFVLLILFMVNYMGRGALFCTSDNLLDSIYYKSTPFCILSGMVLYYCMLQLNLWWIFHVSVLFWKIQFPIHALRLSQQYSRKIHIASIALALSLPLLPVIATVTHSLATNSFGLGFGLATFPPILCYTLNKDVVFYSFILPVTLLMLFGVTLILLTIRAVYKQHGLFRTKSGNEGTSAPVGTAEKKLLLVFLYFFLLTVVSYTGFSLFHRKVERYSTELRTYFTCEQSGHDPAHPCDRSTVESLAYPGATVVAFILIELSPLVNFVFVVSYQDLKRSFKSLRSGNLNI